MHVGNLACLLAWLCGESVSSFPTARSTSWRHWGVSQKRLFIHACCDSVKRASCPSLLDCLYLKMWTMNGESTFTSQKWGMCVCELVCVCRLVGKETVRCVHVHMRCCNIRARLLVFCCNYRNRLVTKSLKVMICPACQSRMTIWTPQLWWWLMMV